MKNERIRITCIGFFASLLFSTFAMAAGPSHEYHVDTDGRAAVTMPGEDGESSQTGDSVDFNSDNFNGENATPDNSSIDFDDADGGGSGGG